MEWAIEDIDAIEVEVVEQEAEHDQLLPPIGEVAQLLQRPPPVAQSVAVYGQQHPHEHQGELVLRQQPLEVREKLIGKRVVEIAFWHFKWLDAHVGRPAP